jgi:hypothetical protein
MTRGLRKDYKRRRQEASELLKFTSPERVLMVEETADGEVSEEDFSYKRNRMGRMRS